ncbi:hypothetical protein niasHS_018039 [Heterodera schachtii]|uniref:HAT C-terminal dimerisation domain-containing protein n=1 Tax=Heterodera schachtii TaxID=97005 RepID=A0ABD2HP79_HETSC
MPPKRKNVYLESYEKEFRHIKKSRKGEEFALCVVCNDDINLLSIGKSAISLHQKTGKHQKAAKAANRSIPLQEFLPNTSAPSTEDRKILAAEGTIAYNTAQHCQSFCSLDCLSSDGLLRTIFPDSTIAKKISCGQTKTSKILTGVLAPYSVKKIVEQLADKPFSLSIDASNFGNQKLFPLVVRFFTKDNGIETRLIDLESLPGETSFEVHQWINKIMEKYDLNVSNLTALSADNTKANFGGEERAGENNLFFRLRQQNERLIGVGCVCHVLHNAAKKATDNLRIEGRAMDIEAVIFKMAGHFKNSTKRIEELKGFCEELEVEFELLNRHGPTRVDINEQRVGQNYSDGIFVLHIGSAYLDKWHRVDRFPEKLEWVALVSRKIPHDDALSLARQIAPELTNDLFDDVSEANQILNSFPNDEFQQLTPEQKWKKRFEADLPNLLKLVSVVLSVPVSNAFVERVFSLCGSQWTDVRNSLQVGTVKALVQTKVNYDLSCPQIYHVLISNHKLLEKIGGWENTFDNQFQLFLR